MSLSTFDKTQSQYERKMARQRQLEAMEAAAAGKLVDAENVSVGGESTGSNKSKGKDDDDDSRGSAAPKGSSHRSGVHNPPDGAVESARKFLWDEDEEDYSVPSRMFGGAQTSLIANTQAGSGGSARNLHDVSLTRGTADGRQQGSQDQGSGLTSRVRQMVSNLPMFSQPVDEKENLNRNIAPAANASMAEGMEDYLEDVEVHGRRDGMGRKTARARCGSFCDNRTRKRTMLVLAVLALVAVIISVVVTKTGGDDSEDSGESVSSSRPEVDMVRFDAIRELILESEFSIKADLDKSGTPQNEALNWISFLDAAKLKADDDMILQRYALATFFFATYVASEEEEESSGPDGTIVPPGEGWVNSQHWMTAKGICLWYGVSCMPHLHEGKEEYHYNENNAVVHLNLTANNVKGTLPREIAALEDLVTLDLGKNKLKGRIPYEIGGLKELVNLYLIENEFTGTIPASIGDLSSLRNLHLGTNKFSGRVPLEVIDLTDLRALGLDENYLTGTIHRSIEDLQNLIILYLDQNIFTGTIPPNIGNLPNLADLRLRKNKLKGKIPEELGGLKHVELLYLDDNQLTGTIPDIFGNMERLEEIQLYKNKFTGPLPESIGGLDDLKVLYADNNEFTGSIPTSYGNLDDVATLYLHSNKLSGPIPNSIGGMEDLRDFRVYENELTGSLPSEMGQLFKLETLYLEDNNLGGNVPIQLKELSKLTALRIYGNQFSGTIPKPVCDLTKNELDFFAADCGAPFESGGIVCECCHKCYDPQG